MLPSPVAFKTVNGEAEEQGRLLSTAEQTWSLPLAMETGLLRVALPSVSRPVASGGVPPGRTWSSSGVSNGRDGMLLKLASRGATKELALVL